MYAILNEPILKIVPCKIIVRICIKEGATKYQKQVHRHNYSFWVCTLLLKNCTTTSGSLVLNTTFK